MTTKSPAATERGLSVPRFYTRAGQEAFDTARWTTHDCVIRDGDDVVFEHRGVEVPEHWSPAARDILVSKYMRRAGVPGTERETSAQQVFSRLAACWAAWGQDHGYFATAEDATTFEAEVTFMLLHQVAAPNSPQWFNTGLAHSYAIAGNAQGHFYVDPVSGELRKSHDAYSRPQPHACFIQSCTDTLVGAGGIVELLAREALLFKYGSGTGTNFSELRAEGEPLSTGGVSSGLMSFLEVLDRAAGAIKSGGTTRRAAKMVLLDIDHPDVEAFIAWKVEEEKKARALLESGFSGGFEGTAYRTVSGQNSNNSVRIPDAFMQAIERDGTWELRYRTGERAVAKRVRARELWEGLAHAAWTCADPGVQFSTTIDEWHTCPNSGAIRASNPCSEYLFVDDTACNLASLNLASFLRDSRERFDVQAFRHAVRLWTVVLDISNTMASFPSARIAERTHEFRTVGLGYANLGALLMRAGIAYDSPRARAICGSITALMSGEAYRTSAELARELGAFPAFDENRSEMLRVVDNHRLAAHGAQDREDYDGLSTAPQAIDGAFAPAYLLSSAREAWNGARDAGERYGYRNAQVSVIAPTGTIGFVMDCDTTGIEPDFALKKHKQLAGGGSMELVNASVAHGLRSLGYPDEAIEGIVAHVGERGTLEGASGFDESHAPIFACADGLSAEAHVRMVAAAQAFISGAISKTVNLPGSATEDDVAGVYELAWRLGVKAVSLFRDGSKGVAVLERPANPMECPTCADGVCVLPGVEEPREPSRRLVAASWEHVPAGLRGLPYVAYTADKIPLDANTGRAASVADPETWASFEDVLEFCERVPRAIGPGVVFTGEGRVVCLDLDDVLFPTLSTDGWLAGLIEDFGTYTERSLSGRGIHIFFRVREAPTFSGGLWLYRDQDGGEHKLELYHCSRYVALTGDLWRYDGASDELEERTAQLEALLSRSEPLGFARRQGANSGGGPRRANSDLMLALFAALGVELHEDCVRWLVHCPFHDDRRKSLSVNPEAGFYCHAAGCRQNGGAQRIRTLVRDMDDAELECVSKRTGRDLERLVALRNLLSQRRCVEPEEVRAC